MIGGIFCIVCAVLAFVFGYVLALIMATRKVEEKCEDIEDIIKREG